eukprot:TRINITY_DN23053_c0_g1_i1.p1 TRINITY_DN23053_c0_g1~~TRINITY_DN23053_c0_g1_i1.p1  ORF type:complete len:447 (+),score=88.50 TRINITY_DN23053_c0_g1_i1:96-1436(+)
MSVDVHAAMGETFHRCMGSTFSRMVMTLVPGARARQVEGLRQKFNQQSWPLPDPEWRANRRGGHVKLPKARDDEARLRILHQSCRAKDVDEVVALAMHFPYLLSLTDGFGLTALHCAAQTGDPDFFARVLALYRQPSAYERRLVSFPDAEDLRCDGLRLHIGNGLPAERGRREKQRKELPVVVAEVPAWSRSGTAGIRRGDQLEGVADGQRILKSLGPSKRQRLPSAREILCALEEDGPLVSTVFPVSLSFRRPPHLEILEQDTWDFVETAAAGDPAFQKIKRLIARERRLLEKAAEEAPPEIKPFGFDFDSPKDPSTPSAVSAVCSLPRGGSRSLRGSPLSAAGAAMAARQLRCGSDGSLAETEVSRSAAASATGESQEDEEQRTIKLPPLSGSESAPLLLGVTSGKTPTSTKSLSRAALSEPRLPRLLDAFGSGTASLPSLVPR